MNSTVWKDNLREILKSWPRFLSIFLIMTLGVAFFVGIKSAGPSMIKGAQYAYDEGHLPDGVVLSTMGINQEDINQLNQLEGVYWLSMQTLDATLNPDNQIMKLFTYDGKPEHSLFNLVEGRLPQNPQEIALDAAYLPNENDQLIHFQIGQTVTLAELEQSSKETAEGMKAPFLNHKEFEVVGFVDTPMYFERYARGLQTNQKGNLSGFAVIPQESISGDIYTEVYFWVDEAQQYEAYTREYNQIVSKTQEAIEEQLNGRPLEKLNELRGTLQEEIFNGEQSIQSGYDRLDEGQKQLDDAEKQLDQHQKEYTNGVQKLQEAQQLLDEQQAALNKGKEEYSSGLVSLEERYHLLEKKDQEYQSGLAQWQKEHQTFKEQIQQGQEELAKAQQELDDEKQRFEQKKPALLESQRLLQEQLNQLKQEETAIAQEATEGQAKTIDQAISYFDEQKSQLNDHINELQNQLAQNDQLNVEALQAQIEVEQIALSQLTIQLQEYQTQKKHLIEQGEATDEVEVLIAQVESQMTKHQANLDQLNQELIEAQLHQLTPDQVVNIQEQLAELQTKQLQLAQGQQQLINQTKPLLEEMAVLEDQLTKIDAALEAESQLIQGQQILSQNKQSLQAQQEEGQRKLDEAKAELDQGRMALDSGYQQIESGRQQLAAANAELVQGEEALQEGRTQLQEQQQRLQEAKQSLEDGYKTYEEEKAQFQQEEEKARRELTKAQDQLQEAKDALKELEEPVYYVNLRDQFLAYDSLYDNAQKMNEISNVFPVLFFAIAILVTFTTIKRMVDEQRNYMGTMLQMGYPSYVVISKFASYAGIATVLAIIVGSIIGYLVFPRMIVEAYSTMYNFRQVHVSYSALTIIIVAIIALLSALGPAIWTPYTTLQAQPARLLVPEPPRAGHQIMLEKWQGVWQRLTFNQKMTIRNLLRYKGRNLMTLVGVAGCTMLILTGFGMSDSITGMVEKQFDRIQQFDALVYLDNDDSTSLSKVKDQLIAVDGIKETLAVAAKRLEVKDEQAGTQEVSIITPLESVDTFEQFVYLNDRQDNQRLTLDKGAIITEKLAKLYRLSVGDTFILYDDTKQPFEITVAAIAENYVGHYIYMDKTRFEKVFHEQPDLSGFYIQYKDLENRVESEHVIAQLPNVLTIVDINSLRQSTASALESLNIVTLVLIISAAGLAFVVLYNLTNINVSERIRELSTIKVLGFYDYEVSLYIFYEILVLTALGTGAGLIAGNALNRYILNVVELDELLFYPTIHLKSYLWSAVMTFIFSMLVMIVMHFKLKHINMVEALKSVD